MLEMARWRKHIVKLFFIFKLSISQSTVFRVRYKYRHILNIYVVSFTILFNYTIKTEQ